MSGGSDPAPVLTIDGPGGAGKGTVSQLAAERLGWHLLDSGALYRVLAVAASRAGVSPDDDAALERLGRSLAVDFEPTGAEGVRILLDGEDVTATARSEAFGELASQVAARPAAREALLARQRELRRAPGLVADGRDMGSVVFPDAEYKVYLTASREERARRRYKQLNDKGVSVNFDALLRDIAARDERDESRAVAPLRPAEDARVIDTTGMSIDETVRSVLELVQGRRSGGG